MKIGIIGQGFVGNSIKEGLKNDYPDLLTFDIRSELSICSSVEELILNSSFIFVCVPTPMKESGECYTGIVEDVIKSISEVSKETPQKIVILKTTVPPGTTEEFQKKYTNLSLVFNPEFLTEANAVEDFKNQNRIILGGDNSYVLDGVAAIYRKSFPLVPIVHMTSSEAEMVKYVGNTFLATKVIFANEMYKICEGLDLDYEKVVQAAQLDTRLGKSHWKVPGTDGDFGFGGHCFPKRHARFKVYSKPTWSKHSSS